jgi:drug/metabolite transporter (DMT)-like permease
MSSLSPSRNSLGLLLGFIGVVIFGGTLPATRLALEGFDPFFITSARSAIAGVCALALLGILRRRLPPKQAWGSLVIAALGVVLGFPLFMALAMQTLPAAHGGVVLGVMPIATAIVAVMITDERPGLAYWIAALVGAALVILFALRHGAGGIAIGDLFLLLAVVFGSIGYGYSGRLTAIMPGWEIISWAMVISLPFTLPATWLFLPADLLRVPLEPWLGLLYAALFSQWISFFAWNAGVSICGLSKVSQLQLLQPFVTIALAAVVNHEVIDLETILFAGAVVATVASSSRTRIGQAPLVQT